MAERLITVRISREGQVSAETHGMKGTDCLPYIAVLEDMLDAQAVDSAHTAEFHEEAVVEEQAVRDEVRLRGA